MRVGAIRESDRASVYDPGMDNRSVALVAATIGVTAGLIAGALTNGTAAKHTVYACVSTSGQLRSTTYMHQDTPPTKCSAASDKIISWQVDDASSSSTSSTSTTSSTTSTSTSTTTTTTPTAPGINKDKPFAASSPWNTPTPANTQWFDTPVLHTRPSVTTGDNFRHWYVNGGWAPFYASASDPIWTFQMPNYVAPAWNRNRPAQTIQMRAPENIAPSPDSDAQLAVVEPNGDYIEVWQAAINATTHVVVSNPGPGWATGNVITGLGVGGLVAQGGNNAGTRAANFSFQAGRISMNDMNGSAPIDHALVISLPYDMLKSVFGQPTPFVAPATAADSGNGQGPIVMGSKIGVPANVAQPAGLSPLGIKVFNALRTYGMYVGDYVGGNWPIFQTDLANLTNVPPNVCALFCYWDHGGSSDMEKIGPLLRVANYQP